MTTKRYRDVWDAIEDTPSASENMKIRSVLMDELITRVTQEGMTQLDVARKLGVTQPRVSDLMRGKIDLFSIDALVNMLALTGLHIDVRVRDAS